MIFILQLKTKKIHTQVVKNKNYFQKMNNKSKSKNKIIFF